MENPQSIGGTNIYQPYQDGPLPYNQPGPDRMSVETADRMQVYREDVDPEDPKNKKQLNKEQYDKEMEKANMAAVARGNGPSTGGIHHVHTYHDPLCCCMCTRACQTTRCYHDWASCCEYMCGTPLRATSKCVRGFCSSTGRLTSSFRKVFRAIMFGNLLNHKLLRRLLRVRGQTSRYLC